MKRCRFRRYSFPVLAFTRMAMCSLSNRSASSLMVMALRPASRSAAGSCPLREAATNRTASFSLTVRAQVLPECRLVADDLDFGSAGMLDQAVEATSQIRVTCTAGSSYNVGIGYGLHGSSASGRHMQDPAGNFVAYHLYRDSARTLDSPVGVENPLEVGRNT